MTNETQSTALIEKEPKAISSKVPKQFTPEFLKNKFTEVEKEVNAEVFDLKTEDGRKRIKEVAAGINKSRDSLDTPIRNYLRAIKAQPKVIEADARESKLRFEKLREGVIGPLNEARKYQDDLLDWLNGIPTVCSDPGATSEQIQGWLDEVNNIDQSEIWPELQKKFKVAIENATTTATVTLERVIEAEAQAEKIKQLEKEQAESDKRERIAAENREKEAREIASVAEAKLKVSENNAEELAKKAAEQAIENERVRLAEVAEQEKQEAINRENDKKHRSAINRRALTELIAGGVDADEAKKAIILIAKKQISDIKIFY